MKQLSIKAGAAVCVMLFFAVGAMAQGQPNQVAAWLQSVEAAHQPHAVQMLEPIELQTRSLPVSDGVFTMLDRDQLASLMENQPALIEFAIPRNEDETINLKLARVDVTAEGFFVSSDAEANVPFKNGIHYRGIAEGDDNSVAALSFFDGEVMGFYNNAEGNYTIGNVEGEQDILAVYNSRGLPQQENAACFTADTNEPLNFSVDENQNRGIGCKTVTVYFECDNALYVNKGSSTTNVSNYVTGLFNQVATLYANENIAIQISQIYIWTTADPYKTLTSTSSVLSSFKANRGTSFNGNLAHFLTTRSLGGGIAYVDVICSKSYAYGVSAITSSYQSVPTYSWSVEVVTHELGHNLGSPHTQSCSWSGGALDNCYTTEGGCAPGPAPTNGGTIMSYCHLTATGINFNNGFGTQPGNLIRSRVLNATCLASSGTAPTGLAVSGITSSSALLAWVAIPGATQYTVQYKPSTSSTWITATTTSLISYTLSGLSAGVAYNWQVKTDCSSYSAASTFTTSGGVVTCAAPTSLSAGSITSSSATLSWGAVTGASNYTVQYKKSTTSTWSTLGTFTGTSTSIGSLSASTTYNWKVKASCSSGYSTSASFTTQSVSTVCTAPTGLTTTNIGGNTATMNWTAVPGATSYSIKYRKSTSMSWTNLSNVTTTYRTVNNLAANTTYYWRVKANCNSSFSTTVSFTTSTNMLAEEAANAVSLELYPNPAQNQVHLMVAGWSPDETGVGELYSVAGALLKTVEVRANENAMTVDELPAGVYFVYVRKDGSEPLVARFIKE